MMCNVHRFSVVGSWQSICLFRSGKVQKRTSLLQFVYVRYVCIKYELFHIAWNIWTLSDWLSKSKHFSTKHFNIWWYFRMQACIGKVGIAKVHSSFSIMLWIRQIHHQPNKTRNWRQPSSSRNAKRNTKINENFLTAIKTIAKHKLNLITAIKTQNRKQNKYEKHWTEDWRPNEMKLF